MKTIFLVWFDNQAQYIEEEHKYIIKAFSTKRKAEKFIKNHCAEKYTPDVSFEDFKYESSFSWTREEAYEVYLKCEEKNFMYTRDISKLEIEEIEIS